MACADRIEINERRGDADLHARRRALGDRLGQLTAAALVVFIFQLPAINGVRALD